MLFHIVHNICDSSHIVPYTQKHWFGGINYTHTHIDQWSIGLAFWHIQAGYLDNIRYFHANMVHHTCMQGFGFKIYGTPFLANMGCSQQLGYLLFHIVQYRDEITNGLWFNTQYSLGDWCFYVGGPHIDRMVCSKTLDKMVQQVSAVARVGGCTCQGPEHSFTGLVGFHVDTAGTFLVACQVTLAVGTVTA